MAVTEGIRCTRERDTVVSKQPNSSNWTLASRPNPPTTSAFKHPESQSGTRSLWGRELDIGIEADSGIFGNQHPASHSGIGAFESKVTVRENSRIMFSLQ